MSALSDLDSLRQLQGDIEAFIHALGHPVVVEDGIELFDLSVDRWRLAVEFGKLIFEAWSEARSVVRRVERLTHRERRRMAVQVRKRAAAESSGLEFRERSLGERAEGAAPPSRAQFRQDLVQTLEREYPGWRLERVSNRSDREHSFSAWYTRGCARRGRTAWAFLGLSESETPAAADSMLAFGLIWLDWLRSRPDGVSVPGLKLFLPRGAAEATAHRAACLDPRAVQVEILEWSASESRLARLDLCDYGNVETRLVPHLERQALAERHRELVRGLLGDLAERVDLVPDAGFLSLRVRGLELARVEGSLAPQVYFGLEGGYRKFEEPDGAEFRAFVERAVQLRRAPGGERSHELYRLEGERWLESLLVGDVTKIDPALEPDCVYPQVPAFSGPLSCAMHRGVIDILGVTRGLRLGAGNRLAVIELKVQEEINLPLQGLDYWLRVKWLQERGQFKPSGYFPGIELTDEPPLLYLVSPAFRFHSTTASLIRYFDPAIEIVQVGLNEQWREGIKVLFRRGLRGGGEEAEDGGAEAHPRARQTT
jgi:hypothetical protein